MLREETETGDQVSTSTLLESGLDYLGAASEFVEGRPELPEATGVSGAGAGPEGAAVSPGHKHTAQERV